MAGTPAAKGERERIELRLYGLHRSTTSEKLVEFLSNGVTVLGVLLHQVLPTGTQWAQVWVGTENEVEACLNLKEVLAKNGIKIVRAPSGIRPPTPPSSIEKSTTSPYPVTPSTTMTLSSRGLVPPTPSSRPRVPPGLYDASDAQPQAFTAHTANSYRFIPPLIRRADTSMGYRHVDPLSPLPRNLYIMGLPLDLTQLQFKSMFVPYGLVEHSILLSQLDGLGRRRGFILMSTHREAVSVMEQLHGKAIDGGKLDVSWALRQREATQIGSTPFNGIGARGALPNRVIHPPTVPTSRPSISDCSVIVENLDSVYFPNAQTIREMFCHFGTIDNVTVLTSTPLQALIQFQHPISAAALINSNGLVVGGRSIITRRPGVAPAVVDPDTKFSPSIERPPSHAYPPVLTPISKSRPMLQNKFNPFAADIETAPQDQDQDQDQDHDKERGRIHHHDSSQVQNQDERDQGDLSFPSSPLSFQSKTTRLDATSSPFVPPGLFNKLSLHDTEEPEEEEAIIPRARPQTSRSHQAFASPGTDTIGTNKNSKWEAGLTPPNPVHNRFVPAHMASLTPRLSLGAESVEQKAYEAWHRHTGIWCELPCLLLRRSGLTLGVDIVADADRNKDEDA